jgi:hypothetical protein
MAAAELEFFVDGLVLRLSSFKGHARATIPGTIHHHHRERLGHSHNTNAGLGVSPE